MTMTSRSVWIDGTTSQLLADGTSTTSTIEENVWMCVCLQEDGRMHVEWQLEELEDAFENCLALQCITKVTFPLFMSIRQWDDDHGSWLRLCRLFAKLPNVTELAMSGVSPTRFDCSYADKKIAILLDQVKDLPKLQTLDLKGEAMSGNMPLFFQKLGQLKNLRWVSWGRLVSWGDGCDTPFGKPESYNLLANSLEKLPSLQSLNISNWCLNQPDQCWKPLIEVLRSKSTLKQVHIEEQGFEFTGHPDTTSENLLDMFGSTVSGDFAQFDTVSNSKLDPHQLDALQTFPRIHEALKKHNLSEDLLFQPENLGPWIDAMASVNDRLDCFHYLLYQMKDLLANVGTTGDNPNLTFRQLAGLPPLEHPLYVPPTLWDPVFLYKVKRASKTKKFGKLKEQMEPKELQDFLWAKASSDPIPCVHSIEHQKWCQGLGLLMKCKSLDDAAAASCTDLDAAEIKRLLSVRFPSLEESLGYVDVDPLNLQLTVTILRSFLAKQAAAAAPNAVWPYYDARWKHLRGEDREESLNEHGILSPSTADNIIRKRKRSCL